VDPIALAINTQ